MSNGQEFFFANKANRNAAFSFRNGDGQGAIDGDQGALVHPVPRVLGTGQKVGNPLMEPAPESSTLERAGKMR